MMVQERKNESRLPHFCGFCARRERPSPDEVDERATARLLNHPLELGPLGCPRYKRRGQRQPLKAQACSVFVERKKKSKATGLAWEVVYSPRRHVLGDADG